MTRILLLAVATALVGCAEQSAQPSAATTPPAAAAPSPPAIPDRFHGEWNAKLADCGSGRNPSRLRIGAHQVVFYESAGPVRDVRRHGPGEISVTAELSGEGQTWRATRRWRLDEGGATLRDVTEEAGLVRRRCPR